MKIIIFLIGLILLSGIAHSEIEGTSGTFAAESKSVSVIGANETAPFVYKHGADLGIYEIRLTVNHEVKAPRIDIQKTMFGADVSMPVNQRNGSIYKVLFVVTSRLNSTSIVNAEIRYKVPIYWLKFQKINPDGIRFAKLNKTNWTEINTARFAMDDDYAYYTANVSNFSVFTIYGKRGVFLLQANSVHAETIELVNATKIEKTQAAIHALPNNTILLTSEYLPSLPVQELLIDETDIDTWMIAAILLIFTIAFFILSSRRMRIWRIRMKWRLRRMLKLK